MYGRGRAKGVFSPSLAVTHSTSAQPWATDPPEPTGTVARLSKTPHSSPLRETAPSSSSSLRVVDPVPTTAVRPSNTSPSGGRDASTHAVVDDLVTAAKSHLQHLESDYKELESILARHRREDALHREEVSDDHDERDVRPVQTRRRPADEATAVSFYHNSTALTSFQAPHQQQQQQPPTIRPRSAAAAAHTSSDAAEIRARQLEDARRDAALSALERQLLNTERRLADCQQALEGRTAELRSANAKVRGLSQQLSELRDSNGLLTAEVAALQSTIENERRTTATRRHEIAASGDEARKLRIDLHECRLENAALREEVERLRDKVHTQQEVLRAHAQNPPTSKVASAAAATAANYSDGAPPQPATNRSAPPSGTTSASASVAPLQGGGNPPTATATAATRVIIIGGTDTPSSSAPLPPPAPAAAAPLPPTPVVAAPPTVTSNSSGHDTVAVAPRAIQAADDRASYTTVDGGHDDAADAGMDQPPPRRDTSIVRHLFAHQPSAVASHEPSPVRVVVTTSGSGVERDPAHHHKAMSSSSSRQLPISYEGHMPWTRRDVVGAPSLTTTTTAATQRAV